MTPISQTSEKPSDIVHVKDPNKICLYLGQELIMANSVLDFHIKNSFFLHSFRIELKDYLLTSESWEWLPV